MSTQTDSAQLATDSSPRQASLPVIFATIALAMFMSAVDNAIVATALPAIHHSLNATINWAGWTITIYGLGIVVSLPLAGRFTDRFGRRRIFIWGIAIFTISSMACGLAPNIYVLIAFRFIQAIGGGAIQPSATGIVADHFGKNRDRAIGLFGTIAAVGQLAGPIFGGLLVGYLSWRWIFFVNVPLGVLMVAAALKFIPESALRNADKKIDLRGLVLLSTLVFSVTYGITGLGTRNAALYDPSFLVPMIFAVGLFLAFRNHTKTTPNAIIPLRLWKGKGFAALNTLNFLWGGVGFGAVSLVPLYAQNRYGLTPLESGTILTARAVGALSIGVIAALMLRRTGYRIPMLAGYTASLASLVLLALSPRLGLSSYAWLSFSTALAGLGNGFANPASRNACMQLVPDEVPAITGLRQMLLNIGNIISVAIITAILNRSPSPGMAQAHVFLVCAGVFLFILIPLIPRVPEHKGSW